MTALAPSTSVSLLQRPRWNEKMDDREDPQSDQTGDYRPFIPRKKLVRSISSSSESSSASTSSIIHVSGALNGAPSGVSKPIITSESKSITDSDTTGRKAKARNMKPVEWGKPAKPDRPGLERHRLTGGLGPPISRSDSSTGPRSNMSAELLPQTRLMTGPGKSSQTNGFNETPVVLVLVPDNATFERKTITVPFQPDHIKIGRMTNPKSQPTPVNAFFDSKVLSRQHAELTAERNGRILIKDIKSSNGTFVNTKRLSPENKESDWHEIKSGDLLELGIDIVSEDQKTIVHHKVRAKIEHAGFYSMRDGHFLDIELHSDPSFGGQYTAAGQSLNRPGSQGSVRSTGSAATFYASQQPVLPARQQNFWLHPITMEQIVKKLRSEIESQEKYSLELVKANSTLDSITQHRRPISEDSGPASDALEDTKMSSSKSKKAEIKIARFTDPPAPPPQMPLPEKPDAARISADGSFRSPPFKRTETAKQPALNSESLDKVEGDSELVSMVKALTSARKDLEAQTARVKDLELQLNEEREARERAERRAEMEARYLSAITLQESSDSTLNPAASQQSSEDLGDSPDAVSSEQHTSTSNEQRSTEHPKASVSVAALKSINLRLESKVNELTKETDRMQTLLAQYQKRADESEEKSQKSELRLTEMVERLQQKELKLRTRSRKAGEGVSESDEDHVTIRSRPTSPTKRSAPNGHAIPNGSAMFDHGVSADELLSARLNGHMNMATMSSSDSSEEARLRQALAAALAHQSSDHRNGQLLQAAPYASMLGVVLMGVGLMAFLNGWQRPDH